MAGPFDRFLGPWFNMRESPNVEDRTNEPWPWHPEGAKPNMLTRMTPTLQETANYAVDHLIPPQIPPITSRLQQEAGVGDVGPISPEELLKFMLEIENMNPSPEPTKREPIRRK